MARKPEITLSLKQKERNALKQLLTGGEAKVRTIKRASVLMLMDKKYSTPKAAEGANVSPETARAVILRYKSGGLQRALYDAPRPGKKPLLNEKSSSKIIAMVCENPPKGRERWTLELICQEAIKRKIVPTVGQETIRQLLHSHDLKPWREKNVVCADIDVRVHRKNGKLVRLVRQRIKYK